MINIRNRLYGVIVAIFLVVLAGSTGYYIIFGGQPKFMDCLYMTVITLTTVGYGEIIQVTGNVTAQIYTMVLITFGMGIILYGISTMTALIIEGELTGLLKVKKMNQLISKLERHYIVCGGGETGRPIVEELLNNKEPVVLVESDQDKINRCLKSKYMLYVKGDATEDENLITAGIEKAAGIIIALPSDKDALYVTMTAKMLNKNIRIISKITDPKLEPKLKKAGADRVVSPNVIGALRLASEMIRPAAVNFLDKMLRSKQGSLRIHQINISANSVLEGKKLLESGLKDQFNLLVLGLTDPFGEIIFNPSPSLELKEGMNLIVMGEVDNINRATRAFKE